MKFKTTAVILSLLLASMVIITGTKIVVRPGMDSGQEIKVVTSFYPVYIIALNLTEGTDIHLENLTEPTSGCLHDYQLRPQDMVTLEGADLFLINGGGMESFLDSVMENYPELEVAEACSGIELLSSEEEAHGDHDHDHDHGEYNAHAWLSPERYLQQIENLTEALCRISPENAARIRSNGVKYKDKVRELKEKMESELSGIVHRDVILFHDSFAYFADEFDLHVVKTIVVEGDTALSAGEISEIVDLIQQAGVKVLFCEEQYSTRLAEEISKETDARLYVLDTCVRGEYKTDAYLEAMEKNLVLLKEALKES